MSALVAVAVPMSLTISLVPSRHTTLVFNRPVPFDTLSVTG